MSNKIEIYKTEEDACNAAIEVISNQVPEMPSEEVKEKAYRYTGRYALSSCRCVCGETTCIEYNMEHEEKILIGRAGVCDACGK